MTVNKKQIRIIITSAVSLLILISLLLTVVDAVFIPDLSLISGDEYPTAYSSGESYVIDMNMANGLFTVTDIKRDYKYKSYPEKIDSDEEMRGPTKDRIRSFMEVTLLETKTRTVTTVNSTQHSVDKGGFSVEPTEHGFALEFSFLDGEIVIPAEVVATQKGFSVIMYPENIVESEETHVLDVSILPFFVSGAPGNGIEGNLFIPDGSGALIDYNSEKPADMTYTQKVYSSDMSVQKETDVAVSQGIKLPVFGSIDESGIKAGIISQGSGDSYICANTDGDKSTYLNVCPRFVLREQDKIIYDDNRSEVDIFQKTPIYLKEIRVDYHLEPGADKNYVDMAHMYGDYLRNRYDLEMSDPDEGMPLFLDVYGSVIKKRQYVGIPVDSVYTTTTYGQLGEILNALHKEEIKDVVVQYNNFSKETVWGEPARDLTPISSLGGKRRLKELLEKSSEMGYSIYGAVDISKYYRGSSIFADIYEFAKNMRKEPIEVFKYKPNTYTADEEAVPGKLVRNSRIVPYVKEYVSEASAFDMGISVKGHGNLYRDYSNDMTTLSLTMDSMTSAMQEISRQDIRMLTNGGYEYELEYSSGVMDLPYSASGYDITDMDIPFYQIAVHGMLPYSLEAVNATAHPQFMYLKSLETGASLNYRWIYGPSDTVRYSRESELIYSHYGEWINDAIMRHRQISLILGDKVSKKITGHSRIAENVYITTYEDGDSIVVNYNKYEAQTEYGTVPSEGYILAEGGEGQ